MFSEFEATSCQYYKDHLFATLDGFYNIYPKDKEMKQQVFCKGISDAGPAESIPYGLLGMLVVDTLRDYPEQRRGY